MEVSAITRNVRLSAQKGRPLAREVQGKSVAEALKITAFSPLKAAFHLEKTIKSAVANASNNAGLDVDGLTVKLAVKLRKLSPQPLVNSPRALALRFKDRSHGFHKLIYFPSFIRLCGCLKYHIACIRHI